MTTKTEEAMALFKANIARLDEPSRSVAETAASCPFFESHPEVILKAIEQEDFGDDTLHSIYGREKMDWVAENCPNSWALWVFRHLLFQMKGWWPDKKTYEEASGYMATFGLMVMMMERMLIDGSLKSNEPAKLVRQAKEFWLWPENDIQKQTMKNWEEAIKKQSSDESDEDESN
jgi:hypothetical protein